MSLIQGGKCRNTLNCKKLLCIRSSCRKDCVENGYPLLQGQRRHCCSRGKHVGTTTRYCICLPDSGGYGSDNLYDSSKCTSSSDCCNKRSKCKNGLCTPPESDASCLATGSLCFVPFTKACCGQCVVTGPTGIEQRCT
ncbi:hypothetical protein Fcan01_10495 [Folsomia candida]|uniref:Uncharacterized protein n=1 Tax=Folsomia candida TaxID=158441 RepID=A0A226EBU4_FOLCA|nr:hypothetical protein Fcan01_10495 [Folsomia candida]